MDGFPAAGPLRARRPLSLPGQAHRFGARLRYRAVSDGLDELVVIPGISLKIPMGPIDGWADLSGTATGRDGPAWGSRAERTEPEKPSRETSALLKPGGPVGLDPAGRPYATSHYDAFWPVLGDRLTHIARRWFDSGGWHLRPGRQPLAGAACPRGRE